MDYILINNYYITNNKANCLICHKIYELFSFKRWYLPPSKKGRYRGSIYTECVTKIWTNFNLNFPLYCASARGCWCPRKLDASSKQIIILYSQNNCDVESTKYNRRAAIIDAFALGAQQRK